MRSWISGLLAGAFGLFVCLVVTGYLPPKRGFIGCENGTFTIRDIDIVSSDLAPLIFEDGQPAQEMVHPLIHLDENSTHCPPPS